MSTFLCCLAKLKISRPNSSYTRLPSWKQRILVPWIIENNRVRSRPKISLLTPRLFDFNYHKEQKLLGILFKCNHQKFFLPYLLVANTVLAKLHPILGTMLKFQNYSDLVEVGFDPNKFFEITQMKVISGKKINAILWLIPLNL